MDKKVAYTFNPDNGILSRGCEAVAFVLLQEYGAAIADAMNRLEDTYPHWRHNDNGRDQGPEIEQAR